MTLVTLSPLRSQEISPPARQNFRLVPCNWLPQNHLEGSAAKSASRAHGGETILHRDESNDLSDCVLRATVEQGAAHSEQPRMERPGMWKVLHDNKTDGYVFWLDDKIG